MPYRWVEHTGELEVELDAESEQGVFEAGFAAMRELLRPGGQRGQPLEVKVELAGREHATLLADWLAELAYLGESEGLVPERLTELELQEAGMRATITGRRAAPAHLVKAATYHRLGFEPTGGGRWRGRVVLDV